jgi:hypothetical protein
MVELAFSLKTAIPTYITMKKIVPPFMRGLAINIKESTMTTKDYIRYRSAQLDKLSDRQLLAEIDKVFDRQDRRFKMAVIVTLSGIMTASAVFTFAMLSLKF